MENIENMEKMEKMEMFSGSPTEIFSGSLTRFTRIYILLFTAFIATVEK